MKTIIILSLTLAIAFSSCTPSDYSYNVWSCYTVKAGDSIYSIATKLGTSPKLICDYNSNFVNANCADIPVGIDLIIPPTCVKNPGYWDCETLTADYLQPIAVKQNEAYSWLYDYNEEYLTLAYNFSSIGMKIRVPERVWTRNCIPGSDQYCYHTSANETLYGIAADIYINAQTLLNYNMPWLLPPVVSPNDLLVVQRQCQPKNGTYFCYKVKTNDTFYNLGLQFGVNDYQLYLFNQNQYGVVNSTFFDTENVELMIPVLTASGALPNLNSTAPQTNTLTSTKKFLGAIQEVQEDEDDDSEENDFCLKEQIEIGILHAEVVLLESILQFLDPQ